MSKAGRALKQVLEAYGINQTRLAIEMKVPSSNVNRWVNETRDPSGDAIFNIKTALEKFDSEAAETFVKLYLYTSEVVGEDDRG
ncbi:helix-turn-helix domain-containing protein [Egbenema bharatensis]|uniref:helix-turn-helix domain-containing protein n=1 Tax=Egbenema bharatensis TaxID=3463334 RepID=UPI003A88544A